MTAQSPQRSANVISLELPATLQYLSVLGACLNAILSQVCALEERESASYDVQLAVQELCTNIVHHAYKESKLEERIQAIITVHEHPRRLSVELLDNGKLFDESQVQEPDLEDGQIHGYGLFIIKSLMDEVTYTRQGERNRWYLLKNLEEESQGVRRRKERNGAMDLIITQHKDVVVATLKGRIDAFYAPELREKMEGFIAQGMKHIVLDLTEVQFLDSAGLAALVSVLKRSQQEGGGVKMIMPRLEVAQRILKLTRFDKVFELVDNSELAVKSF